MVLFTIIAVELSTFLAVLNSYLDHSKIPFSSLGLGVPFNIASYALLTVMIAHVCDLVPGDFVHTLGDAHVYLNHVEPLKTQLEREPKEFPKIVVKRKVENIEDFCIDDFEVINYESHPKLVMEMAV